MLQWCNWWYCADADKKNCPIVTRTNRNCELIPIDYETYADRLAAENEKLRKELTSSEKEYDELHVRLGKAMNDADCLAAELAAAKKDIREQEKESRTAIYDAGAFGEQTGRGLDPRET